MKPITQVVSLYESFCVGDIDSMVLQLSPFVRYTIRTQTEDFVVVGRQPLKRLLERRRSSLEIDEWIPNEIRMDDTAIKSSGMYKGMVVDESDRKIRVHCDWKHEFTVNSSGVIVEVARRYSPGRG
ncbi:hypothetical protein AKO1_009713 [Acrasis kona]|uniref:Uncharacterized protein n=1 Tax=Acrasis kona TaxID=1008807 RepID=A0AAW2ZMH2_9EUKA